MSVCFGLLLDGEQVVAAGPMEEVSYGPAPEEFYVLARTGNDVTIHTGSASLTFVDLPAPSLN